MSATRTQIVAAIDARLKAQIVTVSGRVFRWRKAPLAISELPGLIWRDTEGITESGTIGMWAHNLNVVLCYAASGRTTASQATDALNEIAGAIFSDYTLGGLAESVELLKHDIMVGQEGDVVGAAQIEILITYNSPVGTI